MSSFGLPEDALQKICALFQAHSNISEAILFGSRAKGNFRNGSDIDIALKGAKIGLRTLTLISEAYQKLFLPWKLDLVIYETIENQELKEHIDRVGIKICS